MAIEEETNTQRTEPETQSLLSDLARGNDAAFWALWEKYRGYLYGVCLRQMGGIREDAEDALSRAMIKAGAGLPRRAAKITNLKAWLTRLTCNLCVDMHREFKRRALCVESLETLRAPDAESGDYLSESPEDAFIHRETYCCLQQAVDALHPRLREPFTLRVFQATSYGDIAERLAISTENARKRVQQARALLQEKLQLSLAGLDNPARGAIDDRDLTAPMPLAQKTNSYHPQTEEIYVQFVTARFVEVVLSSDVELSFDLLLDRRSGRQSTKDKTLREYVRRHPRGWKKRLELAGLLYATGHWEEAIEVYKCVLSRQPRAIDAHVQLGNILRMIGREAEATVVYGKALHAARKEATRLHLRGLIEDAGGRYEAAAAAFAAAAAREPGHVGHWQALGLTHLRTESFGEALRAFDEALQITPDVLARTRSQPALLAMGRLAEAEQRAIRALALDPENCAALKLLADHRCGQGLVHGEEGQQTRRLIRRLLRLAPGAADAQDSLARYHILRGDWKQGIGGLRTFTEQRRNAPAGWHHFARWLFATGDCQAAADAILRAYDLYKYDAEIDRAACEILAAAARRDELRRLIDDVLRSFPERCSVWLGAGLAIFKAFGDAEQARVLAARGPQLRPQFAHAWFRYGRVLALTGSHRDAITAIEEGWKWLAEDALDDQCVAAAVWLAESFRAIGEDSRARTWFSEAAHQASALASLTVAAAHYWLAKALEAMGDSAGARAAYQTALTNNLLYPARREAQQRLLDL